MLLNSTRDRIDRENYPMTTAEFVEKYGDHELELQNGSERIGEVLDRVAPETYRSSEDVRFTIYSAVSSAAIGRKGYSDRDPPPAGAPHGPEPLSL